jgi:hypothetical protein
VFEGSQHDGERIWFLGVGGRREQAVEEGEVGVTKGGCFLG